MPSTEVNQKNAIALSGEQKRLRAMVEVQDSRIAQLELIVLELRQEIAAVRGIALANVGRGPTAGG